MRRKVLCKHGISRVRGRGFRPKIIAWVGNCHTQPGAVFRQFQPADALVPHKPAVGNDLPVIDPDVRPEGIDRGTEEACALSAGWRRGLLRAGRLIDANGKRRNEKGGKKRIFS